MAKILHLPARAPSKLGFERAKKRKSKDPEKRGQLNLFKPSSGHAARIVSLPSRLSPFEEALMFDERGDPKATELYERAISEGDSVEDAYCNLGILLSRAGKTEEAFDAFTKSLELNPRHLESHYNLANLYFDVDNLRLARQHYEIAAKIDPDFPNIYFNLGLVLAIAEDLQGAIRALDRYKDLVRPGEAEKAEDLLVSLRRSLGENVEERR